MAPRIKDTEQKLQDTRKNTTKSKQPVISSSGRWLQNCKTNIKYLVYLYLSILLHGVISLPEATSCDQTWGQLLWKSNWLLTITLEIVQLNYNYMAPEKSD